MLRGAAAAALVACVVGLIDLLTLDAQYALAPNAAALFVFALATGWLIEGTMRRPLDRRPVRVLSLLALVMLLIQPWLLGPLRPSVEYPPVWHIMIVGLVAGAVSLPDRPYLALAVLAAAGVAISRVHQRMSTVQSLAEAALFLLTCLAAITAIEALRRSARSISAATTDLWQFHEVAATERMRESERIRMDAIVHDRVLAALLLAARGPDDGTAAGVAASAIADLEPAHGDPQDRPQETWAGIIAAAGERLGLRVETRTHGAWTNDNAGEAITDATLEALRNVARHSGKRVAVVHARFTPRLARVSISDPGRGFDITEDTGRSTGMDTSIRARIEGVGGHAHITSVPGQGTRVVISVPRASAAPTLPPARMDRSAFGLVVLFAAAATICHGVIGAAHYGRTSVVVAVIAGTAAILGLLFVTWRAPHTRWVQWGICVGALVIVGALATTVGDPMRPDWQWWFVGALDGVIAVLAFRFSGRVALVTALLVPPVIALVVLASGRQPSISAISDSATQLLMYAVLGAVLRRGLGRARNRIARLARATFEARRAELALEARAMAAEERREALGAAVIPMLRVIVRGPLTREERSAAVRLEAAVRDLLVARRVVDGPLAALLDQTRRRGVRVELAIASRMPDAQVVDLRKVLMTTLPTVPDGSLVRATWHASFDDDPQPARIVLILPSASAAKGQLAALRTAHLEELVSLRNDDELLILTVLGAPGEQRLPCNR